MADEEKDTEESGSVANYYRRLRLSRDEEFAEDEEQLSEQEALKILIQRLPDPKSYWTATQNDPAYGAGTQSQVQTGKRSALAKTLLQQIPEDMRTRDVLQQGDLRPFMLSIVSEIPAGEGGTTSAGAEVSSSQRVLFSYMFADETERIKADVEQSFVAAITAVPGTPEYAEELQHATALADAYVMAYRDGEIKKTGQYALNRNPFSKKDNEPSAAQKTAAQKFFEDNPNDTTLRVPKRFLSGDELETMLQSGEIDFQAVHAMEQQGQVMRDPITGDITEQVGTKARVIYSDERRVIEDNDPRRRQRRGAEADKPYTTKDWYSVSEIKKKPYSMTREEALAVHEKMKRAGIYDIVGGEPVLAGDVSDPQFERAWSQLAEMALKKGQSMLSILADRTTAMDAQAEAALATSLTDPARLRLSANAASREIIGRHLNEQEQAQMIQFMHDLERRNARINAGLEETADPDVDYADVESLSEEVVADLDARMQEWIRGQNPDLAEAHDITDQYDAFTRMISGPGRGVS